MTDLTDLTDDYVRELVAQRDRYFAISRRVGEAALRLLRAHDSGLFASRLDSLGRADPAAKAAIESLRTALEIP